MSQSMYVCGPGEAEKTDLLGLEEGVVTLHRPLGNTEDRFRAF